MWFTLSAIFNLVSYRDCDGAWASGGGGYFELGIDLTFLVVFV